VLEVVVVEIQRQLARIKVIQSPNAIMTTTGVETIIALSMNVIKGGIVIGSITNLGCGLGGVSVGRNLSRSSRLLATNTRVVGTPHIVFTNPIMTIHVNRIEDSPSMSSIVAEWYKSTNVENAKRRC
jgi:hypothetical protein